MRLVFALTAMLLLSGCWVGDMFFAANESQQVVAPGLYRQTDGNGVTKRIRVSRQPDGMAHIAFPDDPDEASLEVGFIPLQGSDGSFIAWLLPADLPATKVVYGMVRRERDGSFLFLEPPCTAQSGAERRIPAGEPPTMASEPACNFSSRAQLIAAMQRFYADPATPAENSFRIERIDG